MGALWTRNSHGVHGISGSCRSVRARDQSPYAGVWPDPSPGERRFGHPAFFRWKQVDRSARAPIGPAQPCEVAPRGLGRNVLWGNPGVHVGPGACGPEVSGAYAFRIVLAVQSSCSSQILFQALDWATSGHCAPQILEDGGSNAGPFAIWMLYRSMMANIQTLTDTYINGK